MYVVYFAGINNECESAHSVRLVETEGEAQKYFLMALLDTLDIEYIPLREFEREMKKRCGGKNYIETDEVVSWCRDKYCKVHITYNRYFFSFINETARCQTDCYYAKVGSDGYSHKDF